MVLLRSGKFQSCAETCKGSRRFVVGWGLRVRQAAGLPLVPAGRLWCGVKSQSTACETAGTHPFLLECLDELSRLCALATAVHALKQNEGTSACTLCCHGRPAVPGGHVPKQLRMMPDYPMHAASLQHTRLLHLSAVG
jgi:hypothetical protein